MPALAPRYFAPRYFAPRYFGTGARKAVILLIADAVAAALDAATLSQAFAVERLYLPVAKPEELTGLRLGVVPSGITSTLLDRRGRRVFDYVIDVGIQQRQEPTPAGFDPSVLLTEEVVDLFRDRTLVGYPAAWNVEPQNPTVYSAEHAQTNRVFTSVVSLTFRVVR